MIGPFSFGRSDTNYHGTEPPGCVWDKKTVRGPKFKIVRIGYAPRWVGRRLIFYFPSGAWWHLDWYNPKSLREEAKT